MTNFDFFKRLGLFVREDFVDREFCRTCLQESCTVDYTPARVFQDSPDIETKVQVVDENVRKTQMLLVDREVGEFVRERLLAIKPALEQHFNLSLQDCEPSQFYLYQKGSFFAPHVDVLDRSLTPEEKLAAARRISIVIFLNSRTDEVTPGFYGGGALTFYGLIKDPQWLRYGFPFCGEPGTLVAFRSNVLHEVKPVTHGERYTVVSWFS